MEVSILILMDLVLLLFFSSFFFKLLNFVSILILMDLVLLPNIDASEDVRELGFNPYFNGSSTSTSPNLHCYPKLYFVSILILMDLVLLLTTS